MTNLTPETTYRYQISATDEPDNEADPSTIFTFTTEATPDTQPPTLVGAVEIGRLTESSATITWATDEMSDSAIKYGLNANALDQVAGSAADVIAHQVILTNLIPATLYSFIVESTDRSDNGPVISETITFTTTQGKDETPPAVPENVIAQTNIGEITLTWTAPSDTDIAGYDILRDSGTGTFTPIATQVTDLRFHDTGLDSSLTYSYQIRAVDHADNFGHLSPIITATPIVPNLTPTNLGDFDNDAMVGFSDFIIFANAFGSHLGDPNYNAISDLNNDDQVGFPDFIIFANVFGVFY